MKLLAFLTGIWILVTSPLAFSSFWHSSNCASKIAGITSAPQGKLNQTQILQAQATSFGNTLAAAKTGGVTIGNLDPKQINTLTIAALVRPEIQVLLGRVNTLLKSAPKKARAQVLAGSSDYQNL